MIDMTGWELLDAKSTPIPCDPSRGHVLHMSERKLVDGGVVVWEYQAFCTCYWSQRYPTRKLETAMRAFRAHLA